MRKIFSVVLVFAIILSMSVTAPVFAEPGGETVTGIYDFATAPNCSLTFKMTNDEEAKYYIGDFSDGSGQGVYLKDVYKITLECQGLAANQNYMVYLLQPIVTTADVPGNGNIA